MAASGGHRVVLIGPPGVGKGTLCRDLSTRWSVPHLSTGAMLRSAAAAGDLPDGLAEHIAGGGFAPDDLILEMIGRRLDADDCSGGYLLDGFPRTLVQAERFNDALRVRDRRLDHVFWLSAPHQVLVDRLHRRAATEDRDDDHRTAIGRRLDVYEERTRPVVDYYESLGLVRPIDAWGPPEEVLVAVLRATE